MLGLKRIDTPIPTGLQIYRGFVRLHETLGGRMPAKVAGIAAGGLNRWLTLVPNTSKDQATPTTESLQGDEILG